MAAVVTLIAGAFDAEGQRARRESRQPAYPAAPLARPAIRVMTYNIRVQTESDGENDWPHRRDMVASVLRFHQADVLCLQEAYVNMIGDLSQRLPGFAWYGVGSADGKESGACNPVFFRASRFELLRAATFWLSATPHMPSCGWDGAYPRAATFVRLRDTITGRELSIFNVHLDHLGVKAREESARLLAQRASAESGDVIVLGDFNCERHESPCRVMARAGLRDAREASLNGHFGLSTSFNDFKLKWRQAYTIDHILVSAGLTVQQEGIPGDLFEGRLPSDHFPVIAELAP
jgi:endonuclease/exonuclease/phosphatase family metal-dependent hydrolase